MHKRNLMVRLGGVASWTSPVQARHRRRRGLSPPVSVVSLACPFAFGRSFHNRNLLRSTRERPGEIMGTAKSLSAEQLVAAFVEHLGSESVLPRLLRIASFWNSFEGWLKWELAETLCAKWGRRAWTGQTTDAEPLSIGVEHRAEMVTLGESRARKQIDLWVGADPLAERYHYVELKVAFKNAHAGKQLDSAASDLCSLRRVRDPKVDGRIALVVAVGFDDADLADVGGGGDTFKVAAKFEPADGGGSTADATPSVAILASFG